MPDITILYAGLLGLISLVISSIAGNRRGQTGVSVGDGGDQAMMVAMRRHANFVEYVPLALILLMLLELNAISTLALHIMGAGLVFCRICHAVGLKGDTMATLGRFIGAAGTALITLVASIWSIIVFF